MIRCVAGLIGGGEEGGKADEVVGGGDCACASDQGLGCD